MELIKINTAFMAFLLLLACGGEKQQNQENSVSGKPAGTVTLSPEQLKNAGIITGFPEQKEIAREIQVSGLLDVPPQNLYSIGARVPGMVKSTSLLQGSHVHRGDVLCVMENPQFLSWQQEYAGNKARLELLGADLKRQQGLAEKNLTSQKILQQAMADFKMLEAAQQALRKKLILTGFSLSEIEKGNFSAELPVTAPSDGFITAVYVNTGQVMAEGAPLCELVNVEHIHAELLVFEKDIALVKTGQEVEFELVSAPEKKHRARVFLINHKISAERTVQVHAHLERPDPDFVPNMQIAARIKTAGSLEWVVPDEALVSDGRQQAVYAEAERPGSFRLVPVQLTGSAVGLRGVKFPAGTDPSKLKIVLKGAWDIRSVAEKASSGE